MSQGLKKLISIGANAALICTLLLVPARNNAAVQSQALSRLTEEMFQRAEPKTLDADTGFEEFGRYQLKNNSDAIKDPDNRIAPEFKVPAALEKRVGFWFDVYTKYGEAHHVIHHVRYPWLVFDVVDNTDIYENANIHRWTKYHKARARVSERIRNVRKALKALSKKKSYTRLTGLEKRMYDILVELPGKRQKVFKFAGLNVRSQLGQRDFIIQGLANSAKYLPYMEEEFKSAGLPTELTRLPFVESSFNTAAESKVGASGIWQIMPKTGRAYLTVNDHVDERNSPLKASLVAIEIFRANYRALKDWPLAVTAYNHGVGGLKGNLKKSRSMTLVDLINKMHSGSFKFASSNFFTSFLAVLHAEKYNKEIFGDLLKTKEEPIRYSVYQLEKPMKVKALAKLVGLDQETFLSYNLDLKNAYRSNSKIPRGFKLLVPFERRYELDTKLSTGLRPVREAKVDAPANSKGS